MVRGFLFSVIASSFCPAFTLWIGRFANCYKLAELATMIPEQLDLFGGSPKPPQKIWVEETPVPKVEEVPAPINESLDGLPPWLDDTSTNTQGNEQKSENAMDPISEIVEEFYADESVHVPAQNVPLIDTKPDPVSDVIAWMEPSDYEPFPTGPEPLIVPAESIVIELPSTSKTQAEPSENEISPVAIAQAAPLVAENNNRNEEPGMQQLNIPPDEILFQRQYYSMRETSVMFNITHSVLRFWENEFDILQPRKNRKGDRYFRPIDIKNLQLIYHLLKVRKFTMDGAREYLRNNNKVLDTFEMIQKLEKVKSFLHELKAHL